MCLIEMGNYMKQSTALYAGDLSAYFSEVDKLPIFTKEEEYALAERLKETGEVDAAQQLVLGNLRFVISIARGFTGYGLPLNDLIQEGNVGLMRAIKKFDPNKKVRLTTYAVHWIKAEINEYVIKNSRMLKLATTKEQRRLFFKVRGYKKDVTKWFTEKEIKNISEEQNVKPATVRLMEGRMYNHDISYDYGHDDVEATGIDLLTSPSAYLPSNELDPEENLEKEQIQEYKYKFLRNSLSSLSERHRNIVIRRWLTEDKPTLKEIAAETGISAEAVRQSEVRAINNMKKDAIWL